MDSPFATSKRRLIQMKPMTPETPTRGLNLSVTQNELQRMLGHSSYLNATGLDDTSIGGSVSILNSLESEQDQQAMMFKEKMDMLFPQFQEVLQGRTNDSEVFDTIQDLIQICVGVSEEIQKEIQRSGTVNVQRISQAAWLDQEMKTWKLLYALYRDRIRVQGENNSMECELPLGASEREVVDHLFSTNATLREHQLIVDWLEATYENRDTGPEVGHSTDRIIGWENTLFQLQNRREVAFGHGSDIVKSLDPDAPIREKRPLHALDEEDNMRLLRCVFKEIRQGHIEEAMALCKHCGQTWRAVLLEGWRLHEDPNYAMQINVNEKLPIEGNPRRDIWKKCAWMIANSSKQDDYWRAIIGAFCGHLDSLKALLGNSWEDLLWAYIKVQIDVCVETEIRNSSLKNYCNMPPEYWNSKMTMDQIFDELRVHNDAAVREYAESKIGLIQKHLMMDNVTELLQEIQNWVEAARDQSLERSGGSGGAQSESLSPHLLRFLSHIVLFMRQIGRIEKEEVADEIIAAYVETLIKLGDAPLVAFYTAALPSKQQIELYSKFMEEITETQARSLAINEALSSGLDVESITRHTVENIRKQMPCDSAAMVKPRAGDITAFDERKIRALEWLTFLPSQRGDLIWQTNCMIRTFLAESKAECVRAAYEMVPPDSFTLLIETFGTEENLPNRERCIMKEFFSYKVYLVALDSFDDWTKLQLNRPKEPELVGADANFTERVASQHKEQVYKAELNRWNNSLTEQAELTRDALYNVLVFPENGWLIDPPSVEHPLNVAKNDWENRQIQMEKLRSICIPEVVLLLYKLLNQSGDHQGCVKLSEILADDDRKLYKVYTKHKLAEILFKLAESSMALLNDQSDAWGFPATRCMNTSNVHLKLSFF